MSDRHVQGILSDMHVAAFKLGTERLLCDAKMASSDLLTEIADDAKLLPTAEDKYGAVVRLMAKCLSTAWAIRTGR